MTHPLFHARTWIFDLDNTLYPAACDLFAQIDVRMGAYIAELLSVDLTEARRVQKDYFMKYGTTLAGLMRHHEVDPHHYLDYVHDIDVSVVMPDERMARALAVLPGRKIVYTNGSAGHARRVMERLGVTHLFEGVFDVLASDFVPKPDPGAFGALIEAYAIDPGGAVMVEDLAKNLIPAHELGITTVWVPTGSEWSRAGADRSFIDYVAEDVSGWLAEVAGLDGAGGGPDD
jgi:putative hydrolase of the HAD superfamily